MTAVTDEQAIAVRRFGMRRLGMTATILAGCAAIVAFVLLAIGRPTPHAPAEAAPVDVAPANPACGERPREVFIDGRRVHAYELVCGGDASTLAALPAIEEPPAIWSTPVSEATIVEPPADEPSASAEQPAQRAPVVVPRTKPKPRPAAQRPPPRPVAAATSGSQEKYGP